MTLAIRAMGPITTFLSHRLSVRTLGGTKTAFSTFLPFPNQGSSLQPFRVNTPRIASQLAIRSRCFSSQKDRSDPTLRFPDASTIARYLSDHKLLNTDYYKEKGITKAIAELASERFADSDKTEVGIEMGIALLILDLQKGRDGYTHKLLPNLGKLELPPMVWIQISQATKRALIDCAKSFKT